MRSVASFTDAWIETSHAGTLPPGGWSHLLQMRGLKQEVHRVAVYMEPVASFTDAWIETR